MGMICSSRPKLSAMYFARVTSKPTYISWPCLVGSVNSMGAKSGEVATVRTPGVTVLISAAAAVSSAAVVEVEVVLPQPTSIAANISAARIKLTVFFIFIDSFSPGVD